MKIYVVTLYRGNIAQNYVGVVKEKPTKEQFLEFAGRFDLNPDEDDRDDIGIVEVDLTEGLDQLKDMKDVYSLAYISGAEQTGMEENRLEKLE